VTALQLFAQATPASADPLVNWANLTATAAMIGLMTWLITKGMPSLLDRHDKAQEASRAHFESILNKIDERREHAAREGHDAAKTLATAIDKQCDTLVENTYAIREFANTIKNK
jgi:hypothetical protein